jgi:integrase
MRGSTRRRGKGPKPWTALWDHVDASTGKRQQKSKSGFRTQKEAQQHLASVVVDTAQGIFVEPSKMPLGQFLLDEWLPAVDPTVKQGTRRTYGRVAKLYIAKRDIGNIPLRGLSPAHVNKLYAQLDADGLSVASRRLVSAVLGRALGDAMRWGKVPRNVARLADPPSLPTSRVQAWSPQELKRFLAHVEHDEHAALWRTLAMTGMRRGEALGLGWECLDLDAASLRVERQLVPLDPSGVDFDSPKNKRGRRTIALDAGTVAVLREHRARQLLEQSLAGDAYEHGDLVFANALGKPILPSTASDRFLRLRDAAGIPVGTLHALRHTHATILLTEKVPLHVVAARLGDDPKTVLSNYAHLLPHSDSDAAETAASVLADKPLTNAAV